MSDLPESVLIKRQVKTESKEYKEGGALYRIRVKIRYDDQCGNKHNSFSITGEIHRSRGLGRWAEDCGGCIHDEIVKHFPELKPLIKWHLTSSDGPMHYIANTTYHALEHGPKMAHLYFEDKENGISKSCAKYDDIEKMQKVVDSNPNLYSLVIDEKTAKVANLDAARNCAIWPEATPEQLRDPDQLAARLPALMEEFKAAIEELGFIY